MKEKTRYINLRTDFGFKRIFGSEKRKNLLIRFLNALLGENMTIIDVNHVPTERQSDYIDGKRIVYDVSFMSKVDYVNMSKCRQIQMNQRIHSSDCKVDPNASHFILEMQNVYEPPFEDRLVYYVSKALSGQLRKGSKYWLMPVVAIAVTNFNFQHLTPRLVHDMGIRDKINGELLTEQLRILLVSLTEVKDWNECETELERLLFLIKNMDKMDNESKAYKCGEYDEFFEAADSLHLLAEEAAVYASSLYHLEDVEASVNFAKIAAREEGREEGRMMEKRDMAVKLLNLNLPIDMVVSATGLSVEEINKLM